MAKMCSQVDDVRPYYGTDPPLTGNELAFAKFFASVGHNLSEFAFKLLIQSIEDGLNGFESDTSTPELRKAHQEFLLLATERFDLQTDSLRHVVKKLSCQVQEYLHISENLDACKNLFEETGEIDFLLHALLICSEYPTPTPDWLRRELVDRIAPWLRGEVFTLDEAFGAKRREDYTAKLRSVKQTRKTNKLFTKQDTLLDEILTIRRKEKIGLRDAIDAAAVIAGVSSGWANKVVFSMKQETRRQLFSKTPPEKNLPQKLELMTWLVGALRDKAGQTSTPS